MDETPKNEFFLQCGNIWEEVDAFLYKNYKFVVNEDGARRYTDNRFCIVDGDVDVSELKKISKTEMSYIVRMLGVRIPAELTGFCRKPKGMLTLVKGKSQQFYENGFVYSRRQAA
jgi:hypothetical protein